MSPRAAARLEHFGFSQVYDYRDGKADWSGSGLPVEGALAHHPAIRDAMTQALTCRLGTRLDDVRRRLADSGISSCVVVDEAGLVLGRVRASDDGEASGNTVEAVMEEGPSTFRPNVPLEEILARMVRHKVDEVVVTTGDGVFLGVLRRDRAEQVLHESRHFRD
jgi:CBS domain-containing protein